MRLRDLFSDDATIDPRAEAAEVTGLAVDSRAVKPGDLFFALAGAKTDGARFIDAAIAVRRGGGRGRPSAARRRCACRSSPRPIRAARWRWRRRNSYPRQPATIAAVTGTSGKTSVAAFTRQIWQRLGHAIGQHRHHRAGVAEAHHLRLADDAGSDRAASAARRNRARRRHPSGVRGLVARARSVSARRRAHRRRRLHQSVARPHGLPSRRRALSRRQAAAVPRSRRRRWRGGDLGRS